MTTSTPPTPPRTQPPSQRVLLEDLHRPEPRPWVQLLLGVVLLLIANTVMGVVAGIVNVIAHGMPTQPDGSIQVGGGWFMQAPGLPVGLLAEAAVAYLLYRVFVKGAAERPVYELGGPGALRELGAGLLVGTALMTLIVAVLGALGVYRITDVGWDAGILTGLAIGIGPGVAEELAFRGFFLRVLDKLIGTWGAIALTSLVFGLLHISNPDATLFGAFAIAAEAGLLLGGAYLLTRRVWLAIGLHTAWNATQSALFGIDVSGAGTGRGLFASELSGNPLVSGGEMGAEASVVALVIGTAAGLAMIWLAHRAGHVLPRRQRQTQRPLA
ncbi:MAG: CPBP family intramembrane metalloprotease [Micrococcales bacterium]|nr:CPBP family intramembrane metalloprotease [Micrococcales bacterium]